MHDQLGPYPPIARLEHQSDTDKFWRQRLIAPGSPPATCVVGRARSKIGDIERPDTGQLHVAVSGRRVPAGWLRPSVLHMRTQMKSVTYWNAISCLSDSAIGRELRRK